MKENFPDAVEAIEAPEGAAFVLACEHAGREIPAPLGGLGLREEDLRDHIAWDIGAADLTRRLAALLGAAAVLQRYSRLLCDCNRAPGAPGSIVERVDGRDIPGNRGLAEEERQRRFDGLYHPFHAALGAALEAHPGAALVTIHSFTPLYEGRRRSLHAGIIFDGENAFAGRLAAILAAEEGVDCRINAPYAPDDGVTHTLKRHGAARGIPHAMIEVRNDLLEDEAGRALWAQRLARALRGALDESSGQAG